MNPCPRCGRDTLGYRPQPVQNQRRDGGDTACTAPDCSWPNPEPGLIGVGRLRDGADDRLQQQRQAASAP